MAWRLDLNVGSGFPVWLDYSMTMGTDTGSSALSRLLHYTVYYLVLTSRSRVMWY